MPRLAIAVKVENLNERRPMTDLKNLFGKIGVLSIAASIIPILGTTVAILFRVVSTPELSSDTIVTMVVSAIFLSFTLGVIGAFALGESDL